jgi:hypothetical protein
MDEQPPEHLTTTEARAGTTEGVVRYVLGFSMLLAVVVLGLIAFSFA